ncbi:MAG TPA: hypothetical protein VII85_00320 [Candidatus Krumholzibacteriaceae bacterium]
MDYRKKIIENLQGQKKRSQIFYLRQSNADGCVRYRQDIPLKALSFNCDEFIIGIADKLSTTNFFFGDLMHGLQIMKLMAGKFPLWDYAKTANFKMSMDYNDDIFSIPASNPAQMPGEEMAGCHEMIAHSDALSVTNEPMRQVILRDNANVAIIPNYFDMATYINLFTTGEESEKRWRDSGKKTTVGYVGSMNHTEDQDVFFAALGPIMRERQDVDAVIMGFCSERFKNEFGARVRIVKFQPLDDYFTSLYETGIDILCVPVSNNGFNKCKSNIKWMEGTYICGAAILSSPIPAFVDLGTDICGIVNWDSDQEVEAHRWREAIEHLIDNPTDRFEMIDKSQRWMVDEWDISAGWVNWREYFRRVLNGESVGSIDATPRKVLAQQETLVHGIL